MLCFYKLTGKHNNKKHLIVFEEEEEDRPLMCENKRTRESH